MKEKTAMPLSLAKEEVNIGIVFIKQTWRGVSMQIYLELQWRVLEGKILGKEEVNIGIAFTKQTCRICADLFGDTVEEEVN